MSVDEPPFLIARFTAQTCVAVQCRWAACNNSFSDPRFFLSFFLPLTIKKPLRGSRVSRKI